MNQRHTASSDFIAGAIRHRDLGPEAYAFADFLRDSDQTLWQVFASRSYRRERGGNLNRDIQRFES